MSGVRKAVWIVVILVLPIIGALVYVLTRADTSFSQPGAAIDPHDSVQQEMTRLHGP
jgi:Phospholipase_D-nuclease N-terminal